MTKMILLSVVVAMSLVEMTSGIGIGGGVPFPGACRKIPSCLNCSASHDLACFQAFAYGNGQVGGGCACDQCDTGYYVNTTSGACESCIAGCAVCASTGVFVCNACKTGYQLVANQTCVALCGTNCVSCSTSGPDKCDICTSGFTTSINQTCVPCPLGCTACKELQHGGTQRCSLCSDDYILDEDENICLGCDPNCIRCLYNGIGNCAFCALGYLLVDNKICLQCSNNCAGCEINGPGMCDKCLVGFQLQPDKKTCVSACSSNCQSCGQSGIGKCDVCNTGYHLTSDNQCTN